MAFFSIFFSFATCSKVKSSCLSQRCQPFMYCWEFDTYKITKFGDSGDTELYKPFLKLAADGHLAPFLHQGFLHQKSSLTVPRALQGVQVEAPAKVLDKPVEEGIHRPSLDDTGGGVDGGTLHVEVVDVEGGHPEPLGHLLPDVDVAHLLVVRHCQDIHLTQR